jgi:hypothetical protein
MTMTSREYLTELDDGATYTLKEDNFMQLAGLVLAGLASLETGLDGEIYVAKYKDVLK